MWLQKQDNECACELKRSMINCELNQERIHPWKPGTELIIQASDKFVCVGTLCCWMCHSDGWEAAGPVCNTWRWKGLLVYFIPDCWCRHNHGLAHPPSCMAFYVKGMYWLKCRFLYSRLCNSKMHQHGNWWACEDQSKIITCNMVHHEWQLVGAALAFVLFSSSKQFKSLLFS